MWFSSVIDTLLIATDKEKIKTGNHIIASQHKLIKNKIHSSFLKNVKSVGKPQ